MNLLMRELSESRRATWAWALGVVAAVLLYMPFYPSVGGSEMMETYLRMFSPEVARLFGLDMMGSGAGYAQATYFGLMGFVLLAIAATGWGSRSVAGAEASGALELTVAHGVTRWQVVLEAVLAMLVQVGVLCLAGSVTIWALNGPAQLNLPLGNLAAVTTALFLLASVVGAAALLGGAVSGRPGVSTATGAFVAVGAYAANGLAGLAGVPWLARLSPFYWAFGQDPLSSGWHAGGLLTLLAAFTLLVLASGWALARRDLGT